MEDLFYNAYAKELNDKSAGTFRKWQLALCWFLLFLMTGSGVLIFLSHVTDSYDIDEYSACYYIAYVGIAMVLAAMLSIFEKKSRDRLFSEKHEDRIKSMKATIDRFLLEGHYSEKNKLMVTLYDRAIKQREEREKMFRRVIIYVLSAIGVIFTNAVGFPENTAWKTTLYVALILVIIVGLAIGPILFAGAFDSKKKTYNFMYVELQAVQLMQEDVVSPACLKTTGNEDQGKNTEAN